MIDAFVVHLSSLVATQAPSTLLWAFLAGVLSSLTPCVYPLIPVTLAVFSGVAQSSRRRAFLLSCYYVLGMATTYTILGIVSAQTGTIFGSLLTSPLMIITLAALLVVLGLFTLDIIHFSFLATLQSGAAKVGGKSSLGIFLMGAMSGLVAAPCVGPVLIVILGVAAAGQSSLWGAALLLSYALGLGALFLLLGTFSGLVRHLPASGSWLRLVKVVIATAIMAVAVYLLRTLSPTGFDAAVLRVGTGALVCLAAFAIIFLRRGMRHESKPALAAGVLLLAITISTGFTSSSNPPADRPGNAWLTNLDAALMQAKADGKPIMLDLYAAWCVACNELDSKTFSNSLVKDALTQFVPARIDFTSSSSASETISEKFSVLGLPTILFLDSSGAEVPGSRITGYMAAEQFVEHLKKVRINH